MSSDILDAMKISAMGMKAQGTRLRVITENIANADTAPLKPGEEPYRRQIITFKNELDRKQGIELVHVEDVMDDEKTPFVKKYAPGHPGADERGYLDMPNVNTLIEVMDVREAQRSYEANMGMIEQARSMVMRTIDLLRA